MKSSAQALCAPLNAEAKSFSAYASCEIQSVSSSLAVPTTALPQSGLSGSHMTFFSLILPTLVTVLLTHRIHSLPIATHKSASKYAFLAPPSSLLCCF